MRRFFGVLVVCGLVVSACSGGSSAVVDPTLRVDGSVAGPVVSEVSETTVDDGLASVLDGEPPSTTVSSDPDEQAAADAMHWLNETWTICRDDPQNCDTDDFAETTKGKWLDNFTNANEVFKRVGATAELSDTPHEFEIFWARKSPSSDKTVGVLACFRTSTRVYEPDGSLADFQEELGTDVYFYLVVLDDDGQWRMNTLITVQKVVYPEDEVDTCSNFDGTELSDEELAAYLR